MARCFAHRWGFSLLSTSLTLIATILLLLLATIWQLPPVKTLADTPLQAPLRIFTRQGDLIAEIGEKQRLPISLSNVPQQLIQAILSTEDQRFYQHYGVDLISLARAMKLLLITGEKRQGASTITMQVARNFFLSKHKTFLRKFQEMLLAIKLEQQLTKKQILTLYLNKIFFGLRAYGVKAAARNYYGKSLHNLSLAEMAMLAGLPQAPSRNNPIVNPTQALKRRNHVLAQMFKQHMINEADYQTALAAPITAKRHGPHVVVHAPYVAEMIRQIMVKKFGAHSAYNGGLSVYSTIDTPRQIAANQALLKGLLAYDKRHGFRAPSMNLKTLLNTDLFDAWQHALKKMPTIPSLLPAVMVSCSNKQAVALLADGQLITLSTHQAEWALEHNDSGYRLLQPRTFEQILNPGDVVYLAHNTQNDWYLSQLPHVQGALISLDPKTGDIQSLVGGLSYPLSHFNRATQAWRQSGSAFKPFIYAAALDQGFTLATLVNDAPVVLKDSGENRLWRPQNDTHTFTGPVRLREGLVHSRNLVSIRVLRDIGVPYARDYLTRFGFDMQRQPKSLSLALGAGAVTPMMLTRAYAFFANGGLNIKPRLIAQVINPDITSSTVSPPFNTSSHIAHFVSQQPASNPTLPQETAFLVADMLKDVILKGTGRQAKILARNDLAGKTGTTNNQIDAWFAGFTPNLVTSVWVGFDESSSLKEFGAQAALPIWIDYMKQALRYTPQHWLKTPDQIIQVKIDPKSGLQAHDESATFEFFRKQYLPLPADSADNTQHSNVQAIDELY